MSSGPWSIACSTSSSRARTAPSIAMSAARSRLLGQGARRPGRLSAACPSASTRRQPAVVVEDRVVLADERPGIPGYSGALPDRQGPGVDARRAGLRRVTAGTADAARCSSAWVHRARYNTFDDGERVPIYGIFVCVFYEYL